MRVDVAELDRVSNLLFVEGFFPHVEVQQGYRIYAREIEIPVRALLRLLTNGERGIEQGAVLEEILVCVLHLHNELLAVLALAIDVENRTACRRILAEVLRIEILHVLYHLCAIKQAIEEVDQQLLIGGCAENALETKIGQQADVAFFCCCHILLSYVVDAKLRIKGIIAKVCRFFEVHQKFLCQPKKKQESTPCA